MKRIFLLTLIGSGLYSQVPNTPASIPRGQGIEIDWSKSPMLNGMTAINHFHPNYACQVGQDQVVGSSGGGNSKTYFACINGKVVCTLGDGVTIPASLIRAFDAKMDQFKLSIGATEANTRRELDLASKRMAYSSAEIKRAKDAGRTPDLAAIYKAAEAMYPPQASASTTPSAAAAAPVAYAAPAPRPVTPPLDDNTLQLVAKGTPLDQVIEKLGPPHGRITGGMERLTYKLTSGATAKIDFEDGKLSEIRIQ